MTILTKFADLFRSYSPEREAKKKLEEARLMLVEHECHREYYTASVGMLRGRIERLEATLEPKHRTTLGAVTPHRGPDWESRQPDMHPVSNPLPTRMPRPRTTVPA